MKTQLIVDSPLTVVATPIEVISGWVLHQEREEELIQFKINGVGVRFSKYKRPDLDDRYGTGFSIYIRIDEYPVAGTLKLDLDMYIGGELKGRHSFDVSVAAYNKAQALESQFKDKRRFVSEAANRPLNKLESCSAPSGLPHTWDLSPDICEKRDVPSAHSYDKDIYSFIDVNSKNGFILDAGAGLRKDPHPRVINAEIYDYPSTDILCIGQSLPFRDNTFEAVLSFAVLEHVDNPFHCADELVRVVKPGGKIYVIIPFLQEEHGYPSHYFNSTRFGVAKLFERCRSKVQWLSRSNSPIFTAHQILSTYSQILDSRRREEFESLTVKELIAIGDEAHRGVDNKFMDLSEEQAFKIAWGTTAIFEK
jgi:SAM-dependent methyltransferase